MSRSRATSSGFRKSFIPETSKSPRVHGTVAKAKQ
jgi:hypothetical protein